MGDNFLEAMGILPEMYLPRTTPAAVTTTTTTVSSATASVTTPMIFSPSQGITAGLQRPSPSVIPPAHDDDKELMQQILAMIKMKKEERLQREERISPLSGVGTPENSQEVPENSQEIPRAPEETKDQTIARLADLVIQSQEPKTSSKALPPGPYDPEGKVPFRVWVKKFDGYCDIVYPRSKEGRGVFMGGFLIGSTLRLYKAIIRSTDNHAEITKKIIVVDDEERYQRELDHFDMFLETRMVPGETIDEFATRFQIIAEASFEGDVAQERKVRHQFVRALLPELREKIERDKTYV
jgi:hypothetical protein